MINILVGLKRSVSDPNHPFIPPGKTEPQVFDNVKLVVLEMDYLGRGLVVPSGKTPGLVSLKTSVFCDAVGLPIEDVEELFDTSLFGREVNIHYTRYRDDFVATGIDLLEEKWIDYSAAALEDFAKAREKYSPAKK